MGDVCAVAGIECVVLVYLVKASDSSSASLDRDLNLSIIPY